MHKFLTVSALVITGVVATAQAMASEELSIKYACVACHEVDFKKVGPSFEDIAKKYKGANEQTTATLVKHIKEGSTGIWGKDIMPAQPLIPDNDVRTLVKWVLSMSK